MTKSVDLLVSLSGEEFKKFYKTELLPLLLQIECEKNKMFRKFWTIATIYLLIAVPLDIFIIGSAMLGPIPSILLLLVFMSFFPLVIMRYNLLKDAKKLLDINIMPILFSYWSDFKLCEEPPYSTCGLQRLFADLGAFSCFCNVKIGNCIQGKYNDLDIKIIETDVIQSSDSDNSSYISVFGGLMLEVDMNKPAPLHMIIKTDLGMLNEKNMGELARVALEDVEFEKEFEVFADNQIEARYILTPAFMERLTKYKRTKHRAVEVAFYNKKAYFFVSFNKNNFTIPATKSVVKFSYYQNILVELAQILALIDTLKFEQKIGL